MNPHRPGEGCFLHLPALSTPGCTWLVALASISEVSSAVCHVIVTQSVWGGGHSKVSAFCSLPPAGTMPEPSAAGVWEPAQGSLYSLQGNHSVLCLADRLGIPNGLDWSADHRTFYHLDSLDYAVHAYDYDMQAGTISERRAPAGLTRETGRQIWGQTVGLREQNTELGVQIAGFGVQIAGLKDRPRDSETG